MASIRASENLTPKEQEALDWLLKQGLVFYGGWKGDKVVDTQTVMEYCQGDPKRRIVMRPTLIAIFLAKYLREHTGDAA